MDESSQIAEFQVFFTDRNWDCISSGSETRVSRFFLQNIEWYVEDKRSSNSGQVYICFRGYPGVNTEIQHNGKYNEDENQMTFVNLKLLGSFKCFIMTGHW